jgi:TonB family protein
LDGDVEYQSPVDTVIVEKAPETIKKRTAPFKAPKKEEEEMPFDEVMLGGIDIIEPDSCEESYNTYCEENKIFDVVEQMPCFPGGSQKLFEYLEQNMRYPMVAEENCIQGRVVVTFVVEKDGSINGVKVVKSVDPSLDKEAARLVKRMPKWCPGKQNGQPVRVNYTIPVTFRLK